METLALILLGFIALYPVVTAAIWMAGALVFRLFESRNDAEPPEGGWPGVTVLIPAYNEQDVIGTCVRGALASDYPELKVLVLDDGSTDETVAAALEAGGGDPRLEVVRDPVNVGKAERLNGGFRRASDALVAVTDADTHVHPMALKLLVSRMARSRRNAAVAAAPHVTNRDNLLCAMQVLEAAAIIGLIRRTRAVTGTVGVVAGVLGVFRRQAVLDAGGYDRRMATEDIDLSWRLLLAGWSTVYEPRALVGMQAPSTLGALWAQRKRWARGQGEVLRERFPDVMRWRNRRIWLLAIESLASLLWIVTLALALVAATVNLLIGNGLEALGFGLAWGVAIAVVGTIQLLFALELDFPNDRRAMIVVLLAPLYPLAYWALAAAAALRCQTVGLVRGPTEHQVLWDIPRERLEARPRR